MLVRSAAGLTVDQVRRLIELGVKGLFDESVYRRSINEIVKELGQPRRLRRPAAAAT